MLFLSYRHSIYHLTTVTGRKHLLLLATTNGSTWHYLLLQVENKCHDLRQAENTCNKLSLKYRAHFITYYNRQSIFALPAVSRIENLSLTTCTISTEYLSLLATISREHLSLLATISREHLPLLGTHHFLHIQQPINYTHSVLHHSQESCYSV